MKHADITKERCTVPSAKCLNHGVFHTHVCSYCCGPNLEAMACELIAWETCHLHVTPQVCNKMWFGDRLFFFSIDEEISL